MSSVFIKEASDYLGNLSGLHVDVKDSSTNKAFCRYQDNVQYEQLRLNAAKNIVLILGFFSRAAGEIEEARMMNTIVIRFSSYSKTVTSADITTTLQKAMDILLDYLNRMRADALKDECDWLQQIDWNNIQIEEIEQPWLQNHYGWDLVLPYKTTLPDFDNNKWLDLQEEEA